MIRPPKLTPEIAAKAPGPDLFMTVVKVADWQACLDWYIQKLELSPLLVDAEHEFALLAAGTGRLGLQGDRCRQHAEQTQAMRLVFLVPDADLQRQRLIDRGLEIGPSIENALEGYREIRLHDPEGTPLTFFSWTKGASELRTGEG